MTTTKTTQIDGMNNQEIEDVYLAKAYVKKTKPMTEDKYPRNEVEGNFDEENKPPSSIELFNIVHKIINPKGERQYGVTLAKKITDEVCKYYQQQVFENSQEQIPEEISSKPTQTKLPNQ